MFPGYKLLLQCFFLLLLALVSQPLLTDVGNRASQASPELTPATSLPVHGEKIANATQATATYERLPIHFEPNRGQTNPHVKFIARGGGTTTFLTATEA